MILPVLSCILILSHRASNAGLLQDSDTKVLLEAIAKADNPWVWFAGDWPLANHFYRPISTLFFELDWRLYGSQAWGYGLTNALLCCACVLLLYWLFREAFDEPWLAAVGAALFGLWHLPASLIGWWGGVLLGLAASCLVGLFRGGGIAKLGHVALAGSALAFLSENFVANQPLYFRMVAWLPGRTASVMLLFCLASLAAYCRYERLTAGRIAAEPTSTDLPATKGTQVAAPGRAPWLWLVLSAVCLVLALGSYEQAVMLPALLLGLAILFRCENRRPHWWPHLLFWGILGGYLLLRAALVPREVSGYQAQQFRDGPGVMMDLMWYLFPPYNTLQTAGVSVSGDPLTWVLPSFTWPLLMSLGGAASLLLIWRDRQRWRALGWLLMAVVAFLPMAWLKMFEHYHYWPAAMKAAYLLVLTSILFRAWASAVSPPGLQAPPRRDPAPGSLPRP